MSQFEIEDILTLDDKSKYLVLDKIDYENKNYLFIVKITDKQDLDFEKFLFVEEVIENNECFLDSVDDDDLYKKLVALSLGKEYVQNVPGLIEELEKIA